MAQAYLDMVERKKPVEKQKAAAEKEKESQPELDFFLYDEKEPKKKEEKK